MQVELTPHQIESTFDLYQENRMHSWEDLSFHNQREAELQRD
jgi:hypothetical protein